MPKIKLLADPEVVALVNKRVEMAEAKAAKDLQRSHKLLVRTVKEAIGSANLERKLAKGLTDHVLSAMHATTEQQAVG